jgi:hypothetical protein
LSKSGSAENSNSIEAPQLESKRYKFSVAGSMPVIDFDITTGKAPQEKNRENLTLELYNPLSGEIFEAKFGKGRIEVDRDGSITYFTTNSDRVSISLFVGRNITLTMNKQGEVLIRTPSKIKSVEQNLQGKKKNRHSNVESDSITLLLE